MSAKITYAICETHLCSWEHVRFPLEGVSGPAYLSCGGSCGDTMSVKFGDPHTSLLRAALLAERATDGP